MRTPGSPMSEIRVWLRHFDPGPVLPVHVGNDRAIGLSAFHLATATTNSRTSTVRPTPLRRAPGYPTCCSGTGAARYSHPPSPLRRNCRTRHRNPPTRWRTTWLRLSPHAERSSRERTREAPSVELDPAAADRPTGRRAVARARRSPWVTTRGATRPGYGACAPTSPARPDSRPRDLVGHYPR